MRDFCKYEKYKYDLFLVCTSSLKKRYFVGMKKSTKKKTTTTLIWAHEQQWGLQSEVHFILCFYYQKFTGSLLVVYHKKEHPITGKSYHNLIQEIQATLSNFFGSHDNLYFVFECDLSLSYLCSLANSQHWWCPTSMSNPQKMVFFECHLINLNFHLLVTKFITFNYYL